MFSVRTKILLVALATIVAAMATFAAVMIGSLRSNTRNAEEAQLRRLYLSYSDAMWLQQKGCQAVLEAVAERPDIRRAVASRNREELQLLLGPTFHDLEKSLHVVQFYVHEPDGIVLIRVHAPSERGDSYVSYRPMISDALAKKQTVSGLELDGGRMSLRTVTPIVRRNQVMGLLEIAVDYDEGLLRQIKNRGGADARIWLRYEAAGPTGLWPKPETPVSPVPELFLYVSTFGAEHPLPGGVYTSVVQRKAPQVAFVGEEGQQFGSVAGPLQDNEGNILGVLEVSRSREEALIAYHHGTMVTVLVAAIVAASGILVLALTLRRVVIVPLRKLTSAARRQYEGDLQARVDHRAGDEFGLLADTFNSLSNRLTQTLRQQQQTIEEVRKAQQAAEEANTAKDQFLAALSHELRTPLTPALLTAEQLEQDASLSPEQREQAHTIRRNVELEARLIDDLLDLTRIARGKLELNMSSCEVHSLLQSTISVCENEVRAKNLEVVAEFAAEHHHVNGDSARLQQVFWNLVKNAVKFTPEGGRVTITTCNEVTSGGIEFVLRVADTGIGMDDATLSRIFNVFEQGSRTITRTFGGLGLGLAISKRLVELHHGRIVASSPGPEQGSVFTVFLPTMAEPAAEERPQPAAMRPDARGLRILMVEDHAVTSKVVSKLLRSFGHEVQLGRCVAEGLELAQRYPFDLVISDLGLPDGTGADLMRQLRDRHNLHGIAVSGYGMQEDVERSLKAGFLIHLTKPITVEALKAAISQAVTAIEAKADGAAQRDAGEQHQ